MKILLIGLITFLAWSLMSTYIYVYMIKESSSKTTINYVSEQNNVKNIDTIIIPILEKHAVIPQNQTVLFAFDKAEYIADSELNRYFDNTIIYCNQNKQAKLLIVGHTDAIGTEKYNMALGIRRAQNIKYYFKNKGLLADKILIESKGETEPADNNNSISGRKANRRAIITIKI